MQRVAYPEGFKRQTVPLCLINTRDCFAFDLHVKENTYDLGIPYLVQPKPKAAVAVRTRKQASPVDDWDVIQTMEEAVDIWDDT